MNLIIWMFARKFIIIIKQKHPWWVRKTNAWDFNHVFQVEHPNVTVVNRVKRGTGSLPQHSAWSANHFCGGDFTQLSGILRSPGYPLYYPNKKVGRRNLLAFSIIDNFLYNAHHFFSRLVVFVNTQIEIILIGLLRWPCVWLGWLFFEKKSFDKFA